MLIRKQPLIGMVMKHFTEVEVEEIEDIQKIAFQGMLIFIPQTHLISLEPFLEIMIHLVIPLEIHLPACFLTILILHIHITITQELEVYSMHINTFPALAFM